MVKSTEIDRSPKRRAKVHVEEAAPPPVLSAKSPETVLLATILLDVLYELSGADEAQNLLDVYNRFKPALEEVLR